MRSLIEKNIYINNWVRKSVLKRHNEVVEAFNREISAIDSIRDYFSFEQFMLRFDEVSRNSNIDLFSVKNAYSESVYYGHAAAIMRYASIADEDPLYLPIIDHGIRFTQDTSQSPFIRIDQGKYAKCIGFPRHSIGPYVHYADEYLDDKIHNDLKNKYGRVLGVFPFHSYENASMSFDDRTFVNTIMNGIAKEFDSVIVCCYWLDFKRTIYKYFKDAGAILMSAGFRSDINFIKRIKSIIKLCNLVYSNQAATFLGYALYLNVPVAINSMQINLSLPEIKNSVELVKEKQKLAKDLATYFPTERRQITQEQIEACNPYWGFDCIKTPEEIYTIYTLNRRIIKYAHGSATMIPKVIKRLLDSNELSAAELRILRSAL